MFEIREVERPYPGLRPFEPWESGIFFGRETHTDRLLEILDRHHFLAVTGPSGSGKSSLVRAGLVPVLPLAGLGGGSDWRIAILRPRDRPVLALARALAEPLAYGPAVQALRASEGADETDLAASHLLSELRRGPQGLSHLVQDLRGSATAGNLLVVVDQFEEIFTYANAGSAEADESDAFIDLLLHASQAKEERIFVVFTMRTDFLGYCTRFLELPEAINRSGYLTPRLKRTELEDAMTGPARVFGADLAPYLVAELVNAVNRDPDQLPVLQHALARMWDRSSKSGNRTARLELQDLSEVGGTDKALSRHADEVYSSLDREHKLAAEWLFRFITEQRSPEAGGQLVRRPRSLKRIAQAFHREAEYFHPVLQAFGRPEVNFITYRGQPGPPADGVDTIVDISHEALMRQWGRLKDWVAKESAAARTYRDLRDRAIAECKGTGSLLVGPDLDRALSWRANGLQLDDHV